MENSSYVVKSMNELSSVHERIAQFTRQVSYQIYQLSHDCNQFGVQCSHSTGSLLLWLTPSTKPVVEVVGSTAICSLTAFDPKFMLLILSQSNPFPHLVKFSVYRIGNEMNHLFMLEDHVGEDNFHNFKSSEIP